jgi:hypothetical protein
MPPAPRKATANKAAVPENATAKKATTKKATTKKATTKKAATQAPAPERAAPEQATTASGVGAAASGAAARAQAGAEDAVVRIRELQAQLLETARRGGASYLQAYEKNLSSMLELTESAAESTQLGWAVTLANSYADFVKRMNDAVIRAGRKTLG